MAKSQREMALSLTPEHFRDTATLKDDSLDTFATISTENGVKFTRGLLGIVWDQNYLRITIDKKTGEATFQVAQWIRYNGDWRRYFTVNYETGADPVQKSLAIISRDVNSCTEAFGCILTEQFAFEVDEALLRRIAAVYEPNAPGYWRFKYGAQSAQDWQDGMLIAEVAGALMAVDAYRSGHGLSAPALSVTTVPPLRLGIHISNASAAMMTAVNKPGITGLLVTWIEPGSLAERSGFKVGDLVIGFDGTPFTSNLDLIGKVRAVPAGKLVMVKVIRAGAETDLSAQF